MFNAIIKRVMNLEKHRDEVKKKIEETEEWMDAHEKMIEELMRKYNN